MGEPPSERPVITLRPEEMAKAQRERVLFRLGAAALTVAALVIYLVSGRLAAALTAGAAAAVSLLASWWAAESVRRQLRPVWRWEQARARRGLPLPFGRTCGWLAIRADRPEDVIAALPLAGARPADWRTGVRAAYEGRVFVTPPLDGWVLVLSTRLPDAGDGRARERLTPFVTDLSRRLETTVLAFATSFSVGYSHFAAAEGGVLRRARADVASEGRRLLDRGDADVDGLPRREAPREEEIFALAGRLSVDPNTLDRRTVPVGDGWLGDLPAPTASPAPPPPAV
jgi:hypothetical protein